MVIWIAKKPFLRKVNKKKRLTWAKKYKHWTTKNWKKVLFADESKFELFSSKHRVYVRRQPNEMMSAQCVTPTVKHGGEFIMGFFLRNIYRRFSKNRWENG